MLNTRSPQNTGTRTRDTAVEGVQPKGLTKRKPDRVTWDLPGEDLGGHHGLGGREGGEWSQTSLPPVHLLKPAPPRAAQSPLSPPLAALSASRN